MLIRKPGHHLAYCGIVYLLSRLVKRKSQGNSPGHPRCFVYTTIQNRPCIEGAVPAMWTLQAQVSTPI